MVLYVELEYQVWPERRCLIFVFFSFLVHGRVLMSPGLQVNWGPHSGVCLFMS